MNRAGAGGRVGRNDGRRIDDERVARRPYRIRGIHGNAGEVRQTEKYCATRVGELQAAAGDARGEVVVGVGNGRPGDRDVVRVADGGDVTEELNGAAGTKAAVDDTRERIHADRTARHGVGLHREIVVSAGADDPNVVEGITAAAVEKDEFDAAQERPGARGASACGKDLSGTAGGTLAHE